MRLDDFRRVLSATASRLDARLTTLNGCESVRAALDGCGAWRGQGWITMPARVVTLPAEASSCGGTADVPLDGEVRIDDRRSVHLRHLGDGRWQWSEIERVDHAEGVLTRRAFLLRGDVAARCGATRAVYEVCWRPVPDAFGQTVYRPSASRFAGFDSEEAQP